MHSFLGAHIGAVWTLGIALTIVVWVQTKCKAIWKKRAGKLQKSLGDIQGELYGVKEHNQALTVENTRQREQVAYWLKADNCFEQLWAVVGLKQVRRQSGYAPDEDNDSRAHLGQDYNIFEPMPPQSVKLPAADTDYEPALILASNLGGGKFRVLVVRPADMNNFSHKRLAEVDAWPTNSGWEFDIPISSGGTGAVSHAMDYIIARARAEGVPVLKGRLIHVQYEAHRARLCHFYAGKYGFSHISSDGYIIKELMQQKEPVSLMRAGQSSA